MSLTKIIKTLFLRKCPSCRDGFLHSNLIEVSREGKCEREGLDAYKFWDECVYEKYLLCDKCDYENPVRRKTIIENSYVDGM